MPGKVSAVDRGNIARLQNSQIAGVVPVVPVPLETLHPLQRVQCRADTCDSRADTDPAHVARRQYRQQVQPDVGRRGPLCQLGFGQILIVVGRQVV